MEQTTKIRLLEWNDDYGTYQSMGEKDISHLSEQQAHDEAKRVVNEFQPYKDNHVSYRIIHNNKILAYKEEHFYHDENGRFILENERF